MNKTMKWFIFSIAAMGVIRFILDAGGAPKDVVKYFSMTAVIIVGVVYVAITTSSHKERLKSAFLLIVPYMVVEVIALGYTWASGRQTIFHAAEYSMGFSIAAHTLGHLIGGLTWEPLLVFVQIEIVWAIYTGGRLLLRLKTKPSVV